MGFLYNNKKSASLSTGAETTCETTWVNSNSLSVTTFKMIVQLKWTFATSKMIYVLKMKIAKQKMKVAKLRTQILQKPRLLSPSWKATFFDCTWNMLKDLMSSWSIMWKHSWRRGWVLYWTNSCKIVASRWSKWAYFGRWHAGSGCCLRWLLDARDWNADIIFIMLTRGISWHYCNCPQVGTKI